MLRVKYLGESWGLSLTKGKIYDCWGYELNGEAIRIVDDSEEDYLYDPAEFEVVEDDDRPTPKPVFVDWAAIAREDAEKIAKARRVLGLPPERKRGRSSSRRRNRNRRRNRKP